MSVFSNPFASAPGQAKAYAAAVVDLLGDRDPIDVLRRTPDALDASLRGLTPEEILRPEAPGKWSVRHVLRHLADSELVWAWRIRLVLAQDRPPLTGYDQDAWADRLGYEAAEPVAAMREFRTVRDGNLRLLDRVTSADLKRVAVHAERGEQTLELMIKLHAGHDLLHLRQMERIRGTL